LDTTDFIEGYYTILMLGVFIVVLQQFLGYYALHNRSIYYKFPDY